MTSISAASNTTATASTSSSTSGASEEMNQFLTILLTQLQNQNPLDPTDTTEFTSQIAQYSSLEQQMNTNDKLDSLLSAVYASSISAISFLGNTVDFESTTSVSQDGNAKWTYAVDNASSVTLTVKDANGNVVYQGAGNTGGGTQEFTYAAGEGTEGNTYTLSVTATDASGEAMDVAVAARVRVDAVDSSSGTLMLDASGYQFQSDSVSRVATASTTSNA